MAKKVKRGGKCWKAGYSTYKTENRVKKNAILRLERHIKNYPNDEAAKLRLEEVKLERPYKRNNTKKGHSWTPGSKFLAGLESTITGKVKHEQEYGQKRDRKPSPSQMADALASALRMKIDERFFGKG